MPTLYWKNADGTSAWDTTTGTGAITPNAANWFTDAAATIHAESVPWADEVDTTYLGYHLTRAPGETSSPTLAFNYGDFGTNVTGACDIPNIQCSNSYPTIHGGTWTGDGFTLNVGAILGGTFSGDNFYLGDEGQIDNDASTPLFTGANFYHTNADNAVNGGIYSPMLVATLVPVSGSIYEASYDYPHDVQNPYDGGWYCNFGGVFAPVVQLNLPKESDTDPGVANVTTPTTYQFNGATKTGTATAGGGGSTGTSRSRVCA